MKQYPPRTHRKQVRARIPADDGRGTPQFSTHQGSIPDCARHMKWHDWWKPKPWRDRKGWVTVIRPE